MDIVFDIDGTLANPAHRLHFIKDMKYWKSKKPESPMTPDWDSFLADEQISKDAPIEPTWFLLNQHIKAGHRVVFITGRSEDQRTTTALWLTQFIASKTFRQYIMLSDGGLFMRLSGDRSPSHVSKRASLVRAREYGYDPKLAFEDRNSDTAMWRDEGLVCCQVADGNF